MENMIEIEVRYKNGDIDRFRVRIGTYITLKANLKNNRRCILEDRDNAIYFIPEQIKSIEER